MCVCVLMSVCFLSYYGLSVWFPDMIKHLQYEEYESKVKVRRTSEHLEKNSKQNEFSLHLGSKLFLCFIKDNYWCQIISPEALLIFHFQLHISFDCFEKTFKKRVKTCSSVGLNVAHIIFLYFIYFLYFI